MDVKSILEKCFTRDEFLEHCLARTDYHFAEKTQDSRSREMAQYIMNGKKPFGCQTEVMLKLMSIITGDDLTRSARTVFSPGTVIILTSRSSGENYPTNVPVIVATKAHGILYEGEEAFFGNFLPTTPESRPTYKKPTKAQVAEAVDKFLASKMRWMAPVLMDDRKVLAMPWALAELFREEKENGIVIDDADPVHPMFFKCVTRDEARAVSKY